MGTLQPASLQISNMKDIRWQVLTCDVPKIVLCVVVFTFAGLVGVLYSVVLKEEKRSDKYKDL